MRSGPVGAAGGAPDRVAAPRISREKNEKECGEGRARSGGREGPGRLIHRRKRRKVESRRLIRETRLPGRAEPLPEPEHVPLPERSEAIAKLAQARAAALTGLRGVVGVQSGGR